jgi:hypothetical protein
MCPSSKFSQSIAITVGAARRPVAKERNQASSTSQAAAVLLVVLKLTLKL